MEWVALLCCQFVDVAFRRAFWPGAWKKFVLLPKDSSIVPIWNPPFFCVCGGVGWGRVKLIYWNNTSIKITFLKELLRCIINPSRVCAREVLLHTRLLMVAVPLCPSACGSHTSIIMKSTSQPLQILVTYMKISQHSTTHAPP